MYLHLKRTPMTFFNYILLFLFSLVPIHLFASERNESRQTALSSVQNSRHTSPAVEVRVLESRIAANNEEYESVMYFEFPGSREVTMMRVRKQEDRRSLPSSSEPYAIPMAPSASHSLPNESKLEKIVSNTPEPTALSQSTEKLNYFKSVIDGTSKSTLQALQDIISQKLSGYANSPE